MFYKIVDLAMVSNIMISMASDLPGCAVSLAICLKGHAQHARVVGSTSWLTTQKDCFLTSEPATSHMFCISPQSDSDGISVSLASSGNGVATPHPMLMQLEGDEDIDYSLRVMHTSGIMQLCRTLSELFISSYFRAVH